jgi:hypothetical protein
MRRERLLVFIFLVDLDCHGQPDGTGRNDGTGRIVDRGDGRRITVDVLALGGE